MGETYRDFIESMYHDRCEVYRREPQLMPNKETRLVRELVHGNVPCFLSQKSLAMNGQTEAQNRIRYEVKLFIAPELTIQQGDEIHVTRQSVTLVYTAGEPFLYTSHQEMSLARKENA